MNVQVVLKRSKLRTLSERRPELLRHLSDVDPAALHELVESDAQQQISTDLVASALDDLGVHADFMPRDQFDGTNPDTSLVIAVGGDGTVLDVSHRVFDVPLLGINSDRRRSVGYFCATDADGTREVVESVLTESYPRVVLQRMQLIIDGIPHPCPCMNDLLVTNSNPGMMSRYVLEAGARSERQASSGIWVSTAAGSTAGIRSAGGTVLPLEGGFVQYLVREPFVGRLRGYELLRGVRHLDEGLRIRSLMEEGTIYIDGPFLTANFGLGSELVLTPGQPLAIVGMHPERRER